MTSEQREHLERLADKLPWAEEPFRRTQIEILRARIRGLLAGESVGENRYGGWSVSEQDVESLIRQAEERIEPAKPKTKAEINGWTTDAHWEWHQHYGARKMREHLMHLLASKGVLANPDDWNMVLNATEEEALESDGSWYMPKAPDGRFVGEDGELLVPGESNPCVVCGSKIEDQAFAGTFRIGPDALGRRSQVWVKPICTIQCAGKYDPKDLWK